MVSWMGRAAGGWIVFLAAVSACGASDGGRKPPEAQRVEVDWGQLDASTAVIRMERTSCYGSCPVYRVMIRGDGSVEYVGVGYVGACGKRRDRIPRAAVQALVANFERLDYFGLTWDKDCGKGFSTDHPSAKTSIEISGRTRRIDHYHGDGCAPEELDQLEDRIDEVAGTRRWVKCAQDCPSFCEPEKVALDPNASEARVLAEKAVELLRTAEKDASLALVRVLSISETATHIDIYRLELELSSSAGPMEVVVDLRRDEEGELSASLTAVKGPRRAPR